MPPHAHEALIVCLPIAGIYVERTRGRETEHRLGDILLCPAGEEHSQIFSRGDVTALLFTPAGDALSRLAESVPLAQAPHARFRGLDALALRLADEVRDTDPQSPLVAEGLALQILGLLARESQVSPSLPLWLRSAREYVRARACGTLRLQDVAAHVDRSVTELSAAYRRNFGSSIGEDARAMRLQRAQILLGSSGESIAAIATECGYYDQAHFTRQFKRAFSLTPLAYRRRLH